MSIYKEKEEVIGLLLEPKEGKLTVHSKASMLPVFHLQPPLGEVLFFYI